MATARSTAFSALATVFRQPTQLHFSEQGTPLLKHSQYFFRQADLRHLQPVLCTTASCFCGGSTQRTITKSGGGKGRGRGKGEGMRQGCIGYGEEAAAAVAVQATHHHHKLRRERGWEWER